MFHARMARMAGFRMFSRCVFPGRPILSVWLSRMGHGAWGHPILAFGSLTERMVHVKIWLVVWNIVFSHILGIIIPID